MRLRLLPRAYLLWPACGTGMQVSVSQQGSESIAMLPPQVQLVARVRRRAWLNGRLIEDVVTDDLDEDEEAGVGAAAADEADEGGDWEADALDEDVRGLG